MSWIIAFVTLRLPLAPPREETSAPHFLSFRRLPSPSATSPRVPARWRVPSEGIGTPAPAILRRGWVLALAILPARMEPPSLLAVIVAGRTPASSMALAATLRAGSTRPVPTLRPFGLR